MSFLLGVSESKKKKKVTEIEGRVVKKRKGGEEVGKRKDKNRNESGKKKSLFGVANLNFLKETTNEGKEKESNVI